MKIQRKGHGLNNKFSRFGLGAVGWKLWIDWSGVFSSSVVGVESEGI